jgi:CheY-like chemotaxis protein
VTTSIQPIILAIGNDPALTYLIGRFAEKSGCKVKAVETSPLAEEVCALQPTMVLFLSVEILETMEALVGDLANFDIPLLACSSIADQARAHDLGVDDCLLHPLTYDNFLTALTAAKARGEEIIPSDGSNGF